MWKLHEIISSARYTSGAPGLAIAERTFQPHASIALPK
jgi:hypothetical protein